MINNKKLSLIMILVSLNTYAMADSADNNLSIDTTATKVVKQDTENKSSDSMEEQIKKAMAGVEQITVLKSSENKIVSVSEASIIDEAKPKTSLKKLKRKIKKRATRKLKRKVKTVDLSSLPMAKTYPMNDDVSTIK